jgi:hypothetical protein
MTRKQRGKFNAIATGVQPFCVVAHQRLRALECLAFKTLDLIGPEDVGR